MLERLGFVAIQGKGSHIRFKHPDGRRTVVPVHANEDIGKGLLKDILNQVRITVEEYQKNKVYVVFWMLKVVSNTLT